MCVCDMERPSDVLYGGVANVCLTDWALYFKYQKNFKYAIYFTIVVNKYNELIIV